MHACALLRASPRFPALRNDSICPQSLPLLVTSSCACALPISPNTTMPKSWLETEIFICRSPREQLTFG
jgi:hypothetical protein